MRRSHACFEQLGQRWDGFDILVHCIAYAPREAIDGEFLDGLTRENFAIAHDISAYSLAALAKAARPHDDRPQRRGADPELPRRRARAEELQRDGRGQGQPRGDGALPRAATSGPEGTRVNAISAGPIRTLAASGVANFRQMLSQFEAAAPLRRDVTIEDVGNVAAFLCSDLASGVTGEITYVDAGYNIMGMSGIE